MTIIVDENFQYHPSLVIRHVSYYTVTFFVKNIQQAQYRHMAIMPAYAV